MKKTYISTPMTGQIDSAIIESFKAAEIYCKSENLQPIYDKDWQKKWEVAWIDNIIYDLELLKECKFILMMPGWEGSSGCQVEKLCADRMGLVVRYFEPKNT